MKRRKMLDIVGLADEKYISEADPRNKNQKASKSKFKWATFLASAACLLLILNIAIIVPLLAKNNGATNPSTDSGLNHIGNPQGSNIAQNPSSDSNNHIENPDENNQEGTKPPETAPELQFVKNPALLGALDNLFQKGNYGNSLDKEEQEGIQDALENEKNETFEDMREELDSGRPESDSSAGSGKPSTDINDNQVTGISEADIAKRSDKHIFYLKGTTLYVYSINGSKSKLEGMYPLNSYLTKLEKFDKNLNKGDTLEEIKDELYSTGWEMYLSSDYKTITLIIKQDYTDLTGVLTVDVSNAPTAEIKDFKIFSGEYVTSRMINNELLLFTSYKVYKSYDKENPLTYIPFYSSNDQEYLTDDIYFPSALSSNTYIMVSRIDASGLKVKESASYLSYNGDVYVSHNNIYLTRQVEPSKQVYLVGRTPYDTDIAIISYEGEWLMNRGTVRVEGYIKNQYSLDEYNGILRIVTTSYMHGGLMESTQDLKEEILKDDNSILTGTSASLYCIDIETMQIVARVEDFAPVDEVVRSVRFDGTMAYVCTSYEQVIIDPVFFFDLSDLSNITYTDTGEIDGYSTSLINIGGGYAVGIGYGENTSTLKIEVYKEVGDKVESVCVEEFEKTRFPLSYKSYYVDRERHLIGFAISSYSASIGSYEDRYLLLYFNGSHFEIVLNNQISHTAISSVRGFYQSNYYYIVTDEAFSVFSVGSLDELPFVSASGTKSNVSTNAPAW